MVTKDYGSGSAKLDSYSTLSCTDLNRKQSCLLFLQISIPCFSEKAAVKAKSFLGLVTTRKLFVYPCYAVLLLFEILDDLFYPSPHGNRMSVSVKI